MPALRLTEDHGVFAPDQWQSMLIAASNRQENSWPASLARKILLAGLRTPLDVERLGAKLRLYPKDNLCEKRILLTPNRFDPVERSILQERFHDHFRFVDVGANVGLYSVFVAANAPASAKILAFEPQPGVKERLQFNIRCNRFQQITHVDAAIGERTGLARFARDAKNRGAAHLTDEGNAGAVLVNMLTLHDALRAHDMLGADAMKVDIEGAEDQALVPFFEAAGDEDLPRLIIMESKGREDLQCAQMALERGYTILRETRMNLLLVR